MSSARSHFFGATNWHVAWPLKIRHGNGVEWWSWQFVLSARPCTRNLESQSSGSMLATITVSAVEDLAHPPMTAWYEELGSSFCYFAIRICLWQRISPCMEQVWTQDRPHGRVNRLMKYEIFTAKGTHNKQDGRITIILFAMDSVERHRLLDRRVEATVPMSLTAGVTAVPAPP